MFGNCFSASNYVCGSSGAIGDPVRMYNTTYTVLVWCLPPHIIINLAAVALTTDRPPSYKTTRCRQWKNSTNVILVRRKGEKKGTLSDRKKTKGWKFCEVLSFDGLLSPSVRNIYAWKLGEVAPWTAKLDCKIKKLPSTSNLKKQLLLLLYPVSPGCFMSCHCQNLFLRWCEMLPSK